MTTGRPAASRTGHPYSRNPALTGRRSSYARVTQKWQILNHAPDTVAAFCAETVVGAAAGCVTAVPGYFAAMRAVCDRHGALLILDEVMCGMGRTGSLHAWEQEGIAPDIQAVAKGLGGGYAPIGGILAAGRVIAALRDGSGGFMHGQTYQAHPVACAAALEVQRIVAEDGLVAGAARQGERLERLLVERFGNHRAVGDIRGRGLFQALEFVADRASRTPFDPARGIAEAVKQAALDRGLGIYPCVGTLDGVRGDHMIVAPPYIVTDAELTEIVDRLGVAVDAVFA